MGRIALVLALVLVSAGCHAPPAITPTAAGPGDPSPGTFDRDLHLPTGQTIRYTISVPAGYTHAKPAPFVLALHYGGEPTPYYGHALVEKLVGPALADLQAIIVAPEALKEGWTSDDNQRALATLLDAMTHSYSLDARRTLVTGYSMGALGTWNAVERMPNRFTAAVAISGAPESAPKACGMPVLSIHSKRDEVFSVDRVQSVIEGAKAHGCDVTARWLDGPTHYEVAAFEPALHDAVPWIRETWAKR